MYGWVRLAAADTLLDWSKFGNEVRRELNRKTGESSVRAVLTQLGVEPGAPVAGAVLAPDVRQAQKHLDTVTRAKDPSATLAASPPNGVFLRFVGRTLPGIDVAARIESMGKNVRLGAVSCPLDALCTELGTLRPAFLGVNREAAYAVYVEGDRVELDFVIADGDARTKIRHLVARRSVAAGGPSGRCTALDPEADLSLCVDAERSGDLGAALGMQMTTSAIATVDPSHRAKIAAEGKKESMRNIELSKPSKLLLDDGTLSVTVAGDGFRALATWRTTDASAKAVDARFAEEKCADVPREGAAFLGALAEAFPDPGKDFKSADRIDHVREAGFVGAFVVLGRSWPNLIKALVSSGFVLGKAPPAKVCTKSEGGRLRMTITGAPIASF